MIETLASVASSQIVSFDLPGHGSRESASPGPIWPPDAVSDIDCVMGWAFSKWEDVSLFAVSLGAYFSLLACQNMALSQVWFLSPLTDMAATVRARLGAVGMSEGDLERLGTAVTPDGEVLSWDYYSFAVANEPQEWPLPTTILHAECDEVVPVASSQAFAKKFGARITILPGGEHWFHTPLQLEQLGRWIQESKSHH